jgi:Cu(I)/Ag(I) efflux system membrane fusion protein
MSEVPSEGLDAGSDARGGKGRSAASRTTATVAGAVVAAFLAGYVIRGCGARDPGEGAAGRDEPAVWICSMNNNPHPPVVQDGPGKCPYCGMDLIPAPATGADLGPRQLHLSEEAQKLAQVRVAPVERRYVEAEVRMVGKVEYDETRVANITARVGGRIDDLYADYVGVPVRKGEHLFQIYSPEILAAQEELLQAIKARQNLERSGLGTVRKTASATVEAAREKLGLWGLSHGQVRDIESRGTAADHVAVNSPLSGIVVERRAVEGTYVKTGSVVYVVADLSQVWVKLDAYESDVPWIRYGQRVEFGAEALPGEIFEGRVAFIAPVLDERSRTVKVRVNVPNAPGRLMPGMFVRGLVRARLTSDGSVLAPDLAGKWISPMHPEVVKDGPGACDVCGMPLVRAETLGYVSEKEAKPPLVIPATSPLITGKRAVVYVDLGGGVFEGRDVVLGPRAGDYYVVREGIEEGDRVVTNGTFKIDSSIQIRGGRAMMSPGSGGPPPGGHHHGSSAGVADDDRGRPALMTSRFDVPDAFRAQFNALLSAYFDLQRSLSRDDFEAARAAAKEARRALAAIDAEKLAPEARVAWMEPLAGLTSGMHGAVEAKDIVALREAFQTISNSLAPAAREFGPGGRQAVHVLHCPMAFGNKGADWLSEKRAVENPYFGTAMFRCGEVTETVSAGDVGGAP